VAVRNIWHAAALSSAGEHAELDIVVDDFRQRVPSIEIRDLGEMTQALGYIFIRCGPVNGNGDGIASLRESPYVESVIASGNNGTSRLAPIPERQINKLAKSVLRLQTRRLRKGTPVMIVRGRHSNYDGKVVGCDNGMAQVHLSPRDYHTLNAIVRVRVLDLEVWRPVQT